MGMLSVWGGGYIPAHYTTHVVQTKLTCALPFSASLTTLPPCVALAGSRLTLVSLSLWHEQEVLDLEGFASQVLAMHQIVRLSSTAQVVLLHGGLDGLSCTAVEKLNALLSGQSGSRVKVRDVILALH